VKLASGGAISKDGTVPRRQMVADHDVAEFGEKIWVVLCHLVQPAPIHGRNDKFRSDRITDVAKIPIS
jgi:hypothetical protein